MEYLYALQFSNGQIKVGRSTDVETRFRQHIDRVSCLGIRRGLSVSAAVVGSVVAAETELIDRCCDACAARYASEWFEGLDFSQVRQWVLEIAADTSKPKHDFDDADGRVDFRYVLKALSAAGYKQSELAHFCRCNQSSISDLASGKTRDPSYFIGATLLQLQKQANTTPPRALLDLSTP